MAPSIENPWQDAENVRQQGEEVARCPSSLAERCTDENWCSFDARSKGQPWPLLLKRCSTKIGGSSSAARTGQLWYDTHAPHLEETVHFGFLLFPSKTSMATVGFNGLTVAAFESRMAAEMARLIERYGGQPHVAPALREIPLSDNTAALEFGKRLLAEHFEMIILLTGTGTRTMVEILQTRYRLSPSRRPSPAPRWSPADRSRSPRSRSLGSPRPSRFLNPTPGGTSCRSSMGEARSSKSELQYRNTGCRIQISLQHCGSAARRLRQSRFTGGHCRRTWLRFGEYSTPSSLGKSTCCSSPTQRRSIMSCSYSNRKAPPRSSKRRAESWSSPPSAPPPANASATMTSPSTSNPPTRRWVSWSKKPASRLTPFFSRNNQHRLVCIGLAFRVPMEIHSLSSGSVTRGQARRLPNSVRLSTLAARDWHRRGGTTGCGV